MIRFLLSCALVLASGGAAHAQNTATVTQTGTANTADVDQTGSGHLATVTQSGGAFALVTQGTSAASFGNHAIVRQSGADSATVEQTGNQGYGDIAQFGSGNRAHLQQGGTHNVGLIYQGRMGVYLNPWAATQDDGVATGNRAHVIQTGSHNSGFDVNELWRRDGGLIYQGTRGGTATDNRASVTQSGDYGQAWTSQGDDHAEGIRNEATILQAGVDNDASTVQGYFAPSRAADSKATIEQTAGSSDNTAYIFQGVHGTSDGDRGTVTQSGSGHEARVYQGVGDPTFVSASAFATSADNTVIVDQHAMGNTATVYQGTGAGASATDSFASIVQESSDNTATVTQSGNVNTATVHQY